MIAIIISRGFIVMIDISTSRGFIAFLDRNGCSTSRGSSSTGTLDKQVILTKAMQSACNAVEFLGDRTIRARSAFPRKGPPIPLHTVVIECKQQQPKVLARIIVQPLDDPENVCASAADNQIETVAGSYPPLITIV